MSDRQSDILNGSLLLSTPFSLFLATVWKYRVLVYTWRYPSAGCYPADFQAQQNREPGAAWWRYFVYRECCPSLLACLSPLPYVRPSPAHDVCISRCAEGGDGAQG